MIPHERLHCYEGINREARLVASQLIRRLLRSAGFEPGRGTKEHQVKSVMPWRKSCIMDS